MAEDGINKRGRKWTVAVYDPQTGGKRWVGTFDSYAEARQAKADAERGKSKRSRRRVETVQEFFERWPKDYKHGRRGRRNDSTLIHNAMTAKSFVKRFGQKRLDELERGELREWAVEHPASVNAVRAILTDAKEDGLIDGNPLYGMGIRKSRGRKDITVLSEEELELLVLTARELFPLTVFPQFVRVAAWTGLRPGELYALRWSAVDFEEQEIRVERAYSSRSKQETDGKTYAAAREVDLFPPAEEALRSVPRTIVDGERSEHVFLTPSGAPFTQRSQHYYWDPVRRTFWAQLPRERRKAKGEPGPGIPPDFDFYELRHFFGSFLANRLNYSPYDIALQMGHDDGGKLAMERYIHVGRQEQKTRARSKWKQYEQEQREREREGRRKAQ